jgi:hypothetical protein
VLVAQTRRHYDGGKIVTALKATPVQEAGKRLYRFKVERTPFQAVLWFAAERTLVVALTPEHLAEVPDKPQPGATQLAAPLQEMLRTRVGPGAQAWAVGHADDWDRTTVTLLLATLTKDDRQLLEKVRTFGVALQFREGWSLNGAFHCADAAAAQALADRLAPPDGSERKPLPWLGARADAGPFARELLRTLEMKREDAWLMLHARTAPEPGGAARSATAPVR